MRHGLKHDLKGCLKLLVIKNFVIITLKNFVLLVQVALANPSPYNVDTLARKFDELKNTTMEICWKKLKDIGYVSEEGWEKIVQEILESIGTIKKEVS